MKKTTILSLALSVLTVALIGTGIWGYNENRDKNHYYLLLNNQFQRMFYDMTGSVESIATDLSKLMVSGQTRENVILYSNIWQNALNAQEKMSQLPIRRTDSKKLEKFLNQLGDYTFTMAQLSIQGETLGEKEIDILERMHNYSLELAQDLQALHRDALQGNVWKGELSREANKKLDEVGEEKNPIKIKFQKFEERMIEYPEMIYDGPFSDHVIEGMRPRLQGDKITKAEAEKKAIEFLGGGKVDRVESSRDGRGRIDTFSFEVIPENKKEGKNNPIYIDISQRKGYPVWILNNREVEKAKISSKQAIKHAAKFLEEKGFENMEPTYTVKYNGGTLILFAYKQGDVIMYPDLIKVKIALDNGEVIGFDATQFLTANYQRDIKAPKLSPEQARKKVSIRAEVEKEPKLCIIPTDSFGELYCYEFKASYKGDKFLIYINADTGEEERILQMIHDENGTLMI